MLKKGKPKEATKHMKYSRAETRFKAHKIPVLRFEDQTLTSFSGLVVFQALFSRLQLRERLRLSSGMPGLSYSL